MRRLFGIGLPAVWFLCAMILGVDALCFRPGELYPIVCAVLCVLVGLCFLTLNWRD